MLGSLLFWSPFGRLSVITERPRLSRLMRVSTYSDQLLTAVIKIFVGRAVGSFTVDYTYRVFRRPRILDPANTLKRKLCTPVARIYSLKLKVKARRHVHCPHAGERKWNREYFKGPIVPLSFFSFLANGSVPCSLPGRLYKHFSSFDRFCTRERKGVETYSRRNCSNLFCQLPHTILNLF